MSIHKILLIKTISGSRLYGLDHAGSDYDYTEVYGWNKFRGTQKIHAEIDMTKFSIDRFLMLCHKGVPQALETMFSQKKEISLIPAITDNYYCSTGNCVDVYTRTIRNFLEGGTEKLTRHSIRLAINLREIIETGRFNPTLNEEQKERVLALDMSLLPMLD